MPVPNGRGLMVSTAIFAISRCCRPPSRARQRPVMPLISGYRPMRAVIVGTAGCMGRNWIETSA